MKYTLFRTNGINFLRVNHQETLFDESKDFKFMGVSFLFPTIILYTVTLTCLRSLQGKEQEK